MSYLEEQGAALLRNGYRIVPIKPGTKRPAIQNWPHARLTASDLSRYPSHGVGVLCGQGDYPIVALDVDTTDEALVTRFTDWCRAHLGPGCERVGRAPKILLVYRADREGWGKQTSAWFEGKQRLEVLGDGQQFVAYHIHPDTGAPYEWVDLLGGLEAVHAHELPVISQGQVAEAIRTFESMAEEAGAKRVQDGVAPPAPGGGDAPLIPEPPVGVDLERARELIRRADAEDYDQWLRVGMALHHEFDGSDEALELWDEWSASASNYVGHEDLESRWAGFGRSGHRPVTMRWLLKLAQSSARAERRVSLDESKAAIAACTDSLELLSEVARRAGEAAGNDLASRAELAGLIKARFYELTGVTVPVADVRKAMSRESNPAGARYPLTEFGNAQRLLDRYGSELAYAYDLDAWYGWSGTHWSRTAEVKIGHLAKEVVTSLQDEAREAGSDDLRAALLQFYAESQRDQMVRHMVNLVKCEQSVHVPANQFDSQVHLLGVGNGAVDLRTGELLPPDPQHYLTITTGIDYDPEATAPLFERTLREVFSGDDEMVAFFQRVVGYSILGQPGEDVLVILYGSGANGKSTVLSAIHHALEAHVKTASSETFLASGAGGASSAGGAREDILRLKGSRIVHVTEPSEGSELREGLVKAMTGGDPIPARGVYSKHTVEVVPTWVVFMPTNHLPIIKGDDVAIWRRLLPIPFLRNFEADPNKDVNRAEKLRLEAEGILAWCIQGALAYQRGGLQIPKAVVDAREEYKSDMDLLGEWLAECCEIGPRYFEKVSLLWESWEAFAKERGLLRYVPSAKALGRRLSSRGFGTEKNRYGQRGNLRTGIRLKQS